MKSLLHENIFYSEFASEIWNEKKSKLNLGYVGLFRYLYLNIYKFQLRCIPILKLIFLLKSTSHFLIKNFHGLHLSGSDGNAITNPHT